MNPMPTTPESPSMAAVDAFARRVAVRLTQASDALPYDITERLRAAREQALAERRQPRTLPSVQLRPATVVHTLGSTATLAGPSGDGGRWWRALVSALWIAALLAGLAWVHQTQAESIASEITEVDTALLADDLPPAAYADPGFLQFIKTARPTGR